MKTDRGVSMNGRSWLRAARTVAAVALLCGCREEGIQGTYTATKFTMQPAGGSVTDVLAAGGSISLRIHPDLSTSGSMVIPASVQGGPLSVGLLGQTAKNGDQVTFNFVADNVLRDAVWTYRSGELSTIYAGSAGTAVVTLSK
jgi:hypothetical protein